MDESLSYHSILSKEMQFQRSISANCSQTAGPTRTGTGTGPTRTGRQIIPYGTHICNRLEGSQHQLGHGCGVINLLVVVGTL